MSEVFLLPYEPGGIGEVVLAHARYYSSRWGFDVRFETQVASELAAFMAAFDGRRDGFWRAVTDGRFAGSAAVDGSGSEPGEARLRWFIVDESYRGAGIGSRLLDAALDFCRSRGFASVHLWTFAGLDAARALYERAGFRLVEEAEGDGWGTAVTEQKFVLRLRRTP